jgi:hypothetical protein
MSEVEGEEYRRFINTTVSDINFIVDEDVRSDLMFVPSNIVSVSVKTELGWRKTTILPYASMQLKGCRLGAKNNLIIVFSTTTKEGETFTCESSLTTAEISVDGFKDTIMMALNFDEPLSKIIDGYKYNVSGEGAKFDKYADDVVGVQLTRAEQNALAKAEKKEAFIKSRNSNSLFGSW